METFFEIDIQRAGLQAMESSYIIATSKNIATIISRFQFLTGGTVIGTLEQGHSHPKYQTYIKLAIDTYWTAYHDRQPQDYQLALLANPGDFALTEFYCQSLVNAAKRFYNAQMEEIKELKKEAAKAKRITKIGEELKRVKNELQAKCHSANSFPMAISELESLTTN